MALDAGDAATGTGLAGLIAQYTKEETGFDPAKSPGAVNALAKAIVGHFVANAEVEVTSVQAGVDTAPGTIS